MPKREIERGPRHALELELHAPEHARAALAPLVVRRDPLVDADCGRPSGSVPGDVAVAVHQTFCTAARPSRPLGRTSITAIRIAKTIACWNVDER